MSEKKLPVGWDNVQIEEVLKYEQPTNYIVDSVDYSDEYKIPVLTAGKSFVVGYTNEKNNIYRNLPVIIFDDFTTASQYVNFPFKVKSSAMKILSVISSKNTNIKYVFYFMQNLHCPHDTHKRYWISVYSKIKITLPTLPEQEHIVAKIEELFSELDNGVASLKKIKEQIKTYRQSVLKSAFEGCEKYEILGSISETRLGKMLDKTKNKGEYQPYLRNINVRWFEFDIADILEMKFEDDEHERYSVRCGDLLICEGGEPGRCAIWKSDYPMKYQKALHRVRLSDEYVSEFVMYYVRFISNTGEIQKYFTGTGIKHLTGESLKKIPIPSTRKKEQLRIVSEIESRFSVCDSVEKIVDESLEKSEALRQAVLKKAFAGGLV